jgi:ectoine hydroxylase-related dioxygenase (phytanoyl-CoA dioxygenase family)
LFSASEISAIRDEFTKHVESHDGIVWHIDGRAIDPQIPAGDILRKYPRYVQPHRHTDILPGQIARKFLTDERVFDICENLIGPTYAAQSMFYFKPPTARGQALHQDNFYLQSHPETCIAAWIAIDDADAENGGLEVVPGSHVYDVMCPEQADESVSFSAQTVRLPPGASRVQSDLKAGDVLFFHGSLIHGSMPNSSKDRFRRVSWESWVVA